MKDRLGLLLDQHPLDLVAGDADVGTSTTVTISFGLPLPGIMYGAIM